MTTLNLIGAQIPKTMKEVEDIINKARCSEALRDTYSTRYDGRDQDWRQEILYFLLPDRFNDGKPGRNKLDRETIRKLRTGEIPSMVNYQQWAESGRRWQGGTIAGITAKIPYLVNLGVTAIWVGPVFKQREHTDTYHGYGIQNFLDVDPRFGNVADLIELVEKAHEAGLRVIFDIIINHTGHNWDYCHEGATDCCPWYKEWPNFYGNQQDASMKSWGIRWRDRNENACLDAAGSFGPLDGVYPADFRDKNFYSCAGGDCTASDTSASRPFSNHEQHHRGDFPGNFRDIATDNAQVISQLVNVFKYWIALCNPDGFRIDTLKHMGVEEARNFCGAIKAFCAEIGKPHFWLIGEVAGEDGVRDAFLDVSFGEHNQKLGDVPLVALSRRNLDSALDIGHNRPMLGSIGRGEQPVQNYLNSFKWRSQDFSGHRYEGNRHISIIDDHDHVSGDKLRFSSFVKEGTAAKDHLVAVPTAIQLFTLGIPCIYYGSEQAFAGPPEKDLDYVKAHSWGGRSNWADRYLRESMFGPEHPRQSQDTDIATQVSSVETALPGFGPFGTSGFHCFDSESPSFVRIKSLCELRHRLPVLRLGDMYGRKVRPRIPGSNDADSLGYGFHRSGHLQAWSRILGWTEAVIVVNPNADAARSGDIEMGWDLCTPGQKLRVVLNTAESWARAAHTALPTMTEGTELEVYGAFSANNPPHLWIDSLPPGEVLVLLKQ